MARSQRLHGAGTWHHVFNRGADRQDLFHDDADRIAFECLLAEAARRFGVEWHAVCLMTNHFHLLVHCPRDALSDALHFVSTTYVSRYNRRYSRSGPLFEGRFKSVLIDDETQLATVARYIHRNPISIVGTAALGAYRWSTYGCYIGRRTSPEWLYTDTILVGWTRDGYRSFVETTLPSDPDTYDGPYALRDAVGPDEIEIAVATAANVPRSELHVSRRATWNRPRLAAMMIMSERRVATAAELADRFALSSASSARAATRRARVMLESDPAFARLVESAIAGLSNVRGLTPNVA